MAIKRLNCYCDHCGNNTCSTNQLCYAEWKLISATSDNDQLKQYSLKQPSPFSSSSPSALLGLGSEPDNALTTSPLVPSLTASSTQQTLVSTSTHQILTPTGAMRLEKTFNCFKKDDPLLIRTVCNETATRTSHVIRRCCHSGDYCNKDPNLLPSEEDALEEIRKYMPEITIVVVALSLLAYIIALVQEARSPDRSQRQHTSRDPNQPRTARINPFKRILNRLLSGLRPRRSYDQTSTVLDDGDGGQTLHSVATTSRKKYKKKRTRGTVHHVHPDDRSFRADDEHSTSKANSVFDTNSMASREPLIKVLTGKPSNQYTARLEEVHSGPYMADHNVGLDGRIPASFQMTLGSAAVDNYKQDTSSGSGAGQPYLTQRSISHDIQLCEVVGRGYFGIVWRGEYKGEPVAVKIFGAQAEPSWERESEIYQTTMLRHKNILGFVATDKRHDNVLTGYWLVTDFYPMGSLYDFIVRNTLSMVDAIRMAFSIANGLSHLHIEIFGTRGKPAIAHRDIKTKNILVKNDGTCCIADLGMAVRYNSSTGVVDVPANTRIGTRRYLAPEVLENKLNLMDFESVKATDIYALGLVLWEILRRSCMTQPEIDPNAPYEPVTQGSSGPAMDGTPKKSQKSRHQRPPEGTSGSGEDKGHAAEIDPEELLLQPPGGAEASGTPSETPSAQLSSASLEIQTPKKNSKSQSKPMRESSPQPGSAHQQEAQPGTPQQQPETSEQPKMDALQAGHRQAHHQSFMTDVSLETTIDDMTHDLAMICEPYEPPYFNLVPSDPSTHDMFEVVVVRKYRPVMSPRWNKFASMREFATLFTECWYDKPQSRLTALRIRKSLSDIARKYFDLHLEYD